MNYLEAIKDYYSSSNIHQREIMGKSRVLAANAWDLAQHIAEHKDRFDKVSDIDFGQFLGLCEKYPDMESDDPQRAMFVNQYCQLEEAAGDVTARTLVATRIHGKGFVRAVFSTTVGRYLLTISLVTSFFIFMLLGNLFWPLDVNFVDLVEDPAMDYGYYFFYFLAVISSESVFIPFFAAGLGTSFFLLRDTQEQLKKRTFDPASIPGHFVRLILGVVAGGILVLFPDLVQLGKSESISEVGVGQGAMAFLLGYGVEIFYNGLDALKQKLMPVKADS